MTLKMYTVLIFISSVISWFAVGLIVSMTNPYEVGAKGLALFYVSLFLSLSSTFSLIGLFIRFFRFRKMFSLEKVIISFRQGILFSLLVVFSLILQSMSLLTLWNAVLLIIVFAMLEFFFMSAKLGRKYNKYI